MVPQKLINFLMIQQLELMSTTGLLPDKVYAFVFLAEMSSCSNCQVTQQL